MIDWNKEKAAAFLAEPRVQKMIEECPENSIVADLGCFTGDISLELVKKKNKVHAYDCNTEFVEMASKKGIPADVANFEYHIPAPDGAYDAIVAGELIEHIYRTEIFLEECNRILVKGGKLIISTPNLAYLGHRVKAMFGIAPGIMHYESGLNVKSPGHIRYFTLKTLTELLQKYGFAVVEVRGSDIKGNEVLGDMFPTLAYHLIIKAVKK